MHLDDEHSYYAVIFTSTRTDGDDGYELMSSQMVELVQRQDGFLGFDSVRQEIGITVSYWKSLESIKLWKAQLDHSVARQFGKEKWYSSYTVRICKVIREYSFENLPIA